MNSPSSARLDRWFLPLLLLTVAAYAARPLMSYDDFWQHAAVGRWILDNRQIPHETLFLWTAKQNWVAHSWGTQLCFALLLSGGETLGAPLGRAFAALMSAATFFVLWRLWQREAKNNSAISLRAVLFFALAIWGAHGRFEARPELFTALFLSVLLSYLVRRRADAAGEKPLWGRREWGIAALFVLWANVHGAFAIGLVTLALTVLGDAVQDRFDRRARALLGLFLLCAALSLCNPYGVDLWRALRQVNSYTFAFLDEWKPPLVAPALSWMTLAPLAILAILALWHYLTNPARRLAHGLWLAFWIYSFCTARRHAWMLAIVCLVVLAVNQSGARNLRARLAPLARGLAARGALLLALLALLFSDAAPVLMAPDNLPTKFCAVLDKYQPPGRMFNGFISAAYLAWRCQGRRELFIDHLQAHPDSLTQTYSEIINATPRGRELLDSQNIGYVTLHNPQDARFWPPLKDYLNASPIWELVYFDENAVLWVRKTEDYAALRAAKKEHLPAELQ